MRTILLFLALSFATQFWAQSNQAFFDIPIFAYHRFGDDRYPSTNISAQVFDEQLKYLQEKEFEVISLGEAVQKWKAGQLLPEKAVIITIDDGYLSFYTEGWPILKKYGFAATIFIQTETVGGSDFMNWDQIKEIKNGGIEIGDHSTTHPYFLNLPEKEIVTGFKENLINSSKEFKKHLGETPLTYAYPYGEWTPEMEKVLKKAGYLAGVVQRSGVFCEKTSMFAIPRFPMGGPFGTLEGFKSKSQMMALRVIKTYPESPIFSKNPPDLKLEIDPKDVNIENAQFFVDGKKTAIQQINTQTIVPFIILKADSELSGRRTLYTLTAPSTDGKLWYWYSYLWVNPMVKE